jgi:L-fucose isomerase-like protein
MAAMGYNFKYLVNFKDGQPRISEAADYLRAVSAAAALRKERIGMTGYRDMRLYGTCYNAQLLKNLLGVEIEHCDLMEVQELANSVSDADINAAADKIRNEWDIQGTPQPGTLENAAKLALSLKALLEERKWNAFSFCDVDGIKKLLKFAPAGAMALLHEIADVVTVPENDSYGTVTALLMKLLTGKQPGYLEFYEFTETSALMGVPDYVPGKLVEGKITVSPKAFGYFGEGLLNISKLKTGTVTLARLTEDEFGGLTIHASLGEAVAPPDWEEAGWTPPAPHLPSLEVKFDYPADEFLAEVAGQHYIIVHGDVRNLLLEFCNVTGVGYKE